MSYGNRRAVVDIEQKDFAGADVFGEDFAYVNFIESWRAEMIAKNARQFFSDSRVSADVDYILIGGYRAGVVPQMRAVIDGDAYDIVAAYDPDNKRNDLHVTIKRRVND